MSNPNYTHITAILDSSGSMSTMANETISGFNTFIKGQKEAPGKGTLTQIHFSSGRNFKEIYNVVNANANVNSLQQHPIPYWVLNDFSDVKDVAELNSGTFVPGGMTPLYDSVGRAITETGDKLSSMKEEDRPEKVLFVIITDGMENSSKNYNISQIKEMIKHQEEKYSWKFIFLGANIDAVSVGSSMGIKSDSSMTYGTTQQALGGTYELLRSKTVAVRSSPIGSADYMSAVSFNDLERRIAMTGENSANV